MSLCYKRAMPVPDELLEILACPETHTPLAMADAATLAALNERIGAGGVCTHSGAAVSNPVEEALLRADGKCVYVIEDGIPNLLIDDRINL